MPFKCLIFCVARSALCRLTWLPSASIKNRLAEMCRGADDGNMSIVWNGLHLLSCAVESGGPNDFSGLNLESSFWPNIPNQLAQDYSKTG